MSSQEVQDFVSVTGADTAVATKLLEEHGGDIDRAIAAFYDAPADSSMAPADDEPATTADESAPPALPQPPASDMVSSILAGAAKPKDEWAMSGGRALGSTSDAASSAAAEGEGAPLDRRNAKKVRVIFWADGFTVEDVTAEEAEAEAKAKAEAAAPRRTGLATLGSASERGQRPEMPKLPPLRKYEDNPEFMSDLKQGIPPQELRELDLSSGTPRPRPVDIMLGDLKSTPYPAELAERQAREAAPREAPKPRMQAFSGAGQTLGGGSTSAAEGASAGGAAEAASASGEWKRAGFDAPQVDAAAPTTTVQVRLASGEAPPQRLKLNQSHTVVELLVALEHGLQAAGVAPRPYVLMDGFPPKPLQESDATLKDAGLLGASVTLRWS